MRGVQASDVHNLDYDGVDIKIEGEKFEFEDKRPLIDELDGEIKIFLPLEEKEGLDIYGEEVSLKMREDGEKKEKEVKEKIVLKYLDEEIFLYPGERKIKYNEKPKKLDFEVTVYEGSYLVVPFDFVVENYNTEVSWNIAQGEEIIENAISWAKSQKENTSYYNGCLRFTQDAYRNGGGIGLKELPWSHASNAAEILGAPNNKDEIIPRGALLFFNWHGTVSGQYRNWGHAGIALEEGEIGEIEYIHADKVVRRDVDYSRYEDYIGWAMPDGNKSNEEIILEKNKVIEVELDNNFLAQEETNSFK